MNALAPPVVLAHAKDDAEIARQLAEPLEQAGYRVIYQNNVLVGDSLPAESSKALSMGGPVVLCGTARAAGSRWARRLVNAAHGYPTGRVFAVQMEEDADLEHLDFAAVFARYWQDPFRAITELLTALHKHYPLARRENASNLAADDGRAFMDQPSGTGDYDISALQQFRSQLREDILEELPSEFDPTEFLTRANLTQAGVLTRAGALLFGKNPSILLPSALVKCAVYHGDDLSAPRERRDFAGTIPEQIVSVRDFVASRIRKVEVPIAESARPLVIYEYPLICIREIIANALVHRDYEDKTRNSHVRIFSDRIEILSPGEWIAKLLEPGLEYSLEQLQSGSSKKNFTLAKVLSWIRLVEGEGSGIPAGIRDCDELGAPMPRVVERDGFVQVMIRPITDWPPIDRIPAQTRAADGPSILTDRSRVPSRTASVSRSESSSLIGDRPDELEVVQRGLTNASGPHFWLVIAPPGLGKSRFLQQLGNRMVLPEQSDPAGGPTPWVVKLVDVRELPVDARSDARLLLASLFGRASHMATEQEGLREIAMEINRAGRPYLCLLDSAELLEQQAAKTLRSCLSQIYRRLQTASSTNVWLAFVVASRREVEWRGVAPGPRLVTLPLTEFKVEVVRQALDDLAQSMQRTFSVSDLHLNATRVHYLSEGLPALLLKCLQWIEKEQWYETERLESQSLFEELARPYIERDLLSVDNRFSGRARDAAGQQGVLEQAFRVLAPYRLFTQSHLSWHVEFDAALAEALGHLGWTIKDLWVALGETDVLSRPQFEPWRETYPPIRRLLYRYFYKTDEQRAGAHSEARKFVKVWAENQAGVEQVVGLVEYLWHEATLLTLTRPKEMDGELLESTRMLSRSLRESSAYTVEELRQSAIDRLTNDEEFQETIGHMPGLFDRLVDAFMSP